MEELIQQIYKQARLLGVCTLFTGKEQTLEDIVHLFTTPQGIEFCKEHDFPNIEIFRLFKSYNVERFGIYIDAGSITLNNPSRAILIGSTSAVIDCDILVTHEVVLLQGAKAIINASEWAVCKTTVSRGCNIICNASGNAIIL